MHQTQKGKQWFFSLKANIDVDARTGLTHSVSATAANVYDIMETANLFHGEACFVSADSGYRGAQKREELKDVKAHWLIAAIFSKRRASKIRIFKKPP
jgi:IS5 family transposase